jgi:hypothetical protein
MLARGIAIERNPYLRFDPSLKLVSIDTSGKRIMAQRGSILLVANRTAQTAGLREAVVRISESRDVEFICSSPVIRGACNRVVDPEVAGQDEAEARLAAALPSLTGAG